MVDIVDSLNQLLSLVFTIFASFGKWMLLFVVTLAALAVIFELLRYAAKQVRHI